MSAQFISIHPDNPQARLIKQACDIIRKGGVAIVPTDSAYAICCGVGEKNAVERIAKIRQIPKNHNFTLICRDLSEISTYAKVSNEEFRLLKANTPGAYTFILKATKEVPRRLLNDKRNTIGIRVPDNAIIQALCAEIDAPLMSCSLMLPDEDEPLSDPIEINDRVGSLVDVIIDGGIVNANYTTVVRFDEDKGITIDRVGMGDTTPFE